MRSAQTSIGSPIETQTSVTSTSAPCTALTGSVSNVSAAPVSFAAA